MRDVVLPLRLAVLVVFGFCAIGSLFLTHAEAENRYLKVHFLDVGQGDAILVETPENINVLIDGGPDTSVLRELGEVFAVGDRYIDLVVATHPDADHIGGLIDVLERYKIGAILKTDHRGESDAAKRFFEHVAIEGAAIVSARSRQKFALGASTTLTVLFPEMDASDMESNASSIVLQLHYGDIEFMLTGDAPASIEEYLVQRHGTRLESEVLKAGHHGSRTSTSEDFVAAVDPDYAVVSAGKDNHYGHPHTEVLNTLALEAVEVLSTAEQGTVTFVTDGNAVWVE